MKDNLRTDRVLEAKTGVGMHQQRHDGRAAQESQIGIGCFRTIFHEEIMASYRLWFLNPKERVVAMIR